MLAAVCFFVVLLHTINRKTGSKAVCRNRKEITLFFHVSSNIFQHFFKLFCSIFFYYFLQLLLLLLLLLSLMLAFLKKSKKKKNKRNSLKNCKKRVSGSRRACNNNAIYTQRHICCHIISCNTIGFYVRLLYGLVLVIVSYLGQ